MHATDRIEPVGQTAGKSRRHVLSHQDSRAIGRQPAQHGKGDLRADSGDVVWVQPGAYAENVTLKPGVLLYAAGPCTLGTGAGAALTLAAAAVTSILSGPWTVGGAASFSASAASTSIPDHTCAVEGRVRQNRDY
jgi:nitrous oxidase accessory protein NosD